MTVSHDCALYRDYFLWVEDYKKIMSAFDYMKWKYGIESNEFYPYKNRFGIVPTKADKENFKKFLLKDGTSFRKDCEMSKVWVNEVKGIEFMRKPSPVFYWDQFVGSASTRLFGVGETLYCSMRTEYEFDFIPSWANVMNASDFYKVMEGVE